MNERRDDWAQAFGESVGIWFTRKMFGFLKKENPLPKVADWATGLPSTSAYGGLCRQSRHRLRSKISL